MNFPQMLFQHIHFAPPEIQKKFYNGISRYLTMEVDVLDDKGRPQRTAAGRIITKEIQLENKEYWQNKSEECTFNGLLIKKDKVFVINIYTFSEIKDYEPAYLEVTQIFNELLKTYNIYHTCLTLQLAVCNYYKDSTLTENLIPIIKHDKPYRLPKFRHQITRHHNRHKKFIDCGGKDRSKRAWNQIIHRAVSRIKVCESTTIHGGKRPSLFVDYSAIPVISKVQHKSKHQRGVREPKERKARRRAYAFTPKSGTGSSGSDI